MKNITFKGDLPGHTIKNKGRLLNHINSMPKTPNDGKLGNLVCPMIGVGVKTRHKFQRIQGVRFDEQTGTLEWMY